jgi:hypothetical protein
MVVIDLNQTGINRVTLTRRPLEGLKLMRKLWPWVEALDAAAFCVKNPQRPEAEPKRRAEGAAR